RRAEPCGAGVGPGAAGRLLRVRARGGRGVQVPGRSCAPFGACAVGAFAPPHRRAPGPCGEGGLVMRDDRPIISGPPSPLERVAVWVALLVPCAFCAWAFWQAMSA